MLGARGSPQGCGTCKKRKVACDRMRPFCQRCLKAGIECKGYERVATFVNRDASNINATGRQALSSAFRTEEPKQKSPRRQNHASPITRLKSESSTTSTSTSSASNTTVKQEPLTSKEELQLALRNGTASASLHDHQQIQGTSVIRLPMLGLITRYYVAEGNALNQAELYHQISSIIDPGPVFDSAISAAALTRCGQVGHKQEMVLQGTDQYVKTIRGLISILIDPKKRLEDETLAVCVLLSAYELFAGTDPYLSPWISHMDGVAQLIQLRGPERHQSSLGHQIFLHYRTSGALQALMSRKSSFLSSSEWLTVPFAITPKDSFHLLLDLVFDLASILESLDLAPLSAQTELARRQENVARCEALMSRFERWFQSLKSSLGGSAWTEIASRAIVPEDEKAEGKVLDTYLEFENLVIVQVLLSYWGASIILLTTLLTNLIILTTSSPTSPTPTSNLPSIFPESIPSTIQTHALNIARSIPFCLKPQHKTAGPIITVHPLHVAMQVFDTFGMGREERWCREVFGRVCRGGNPFRDAASDGEVGRRENVDERRGEDGSGELKYQLHLPEFGKGALRLR